MCVCGGGGMCVCACANAHTSMHVRLVQALGNFLFSACILIFLSLCSSAEYLERYETWRQHCDSVSKRPPSHVLPLCAGQPWESHFPTLENWTVGRIWREALSSSIQRLSLNGTAMILFQQQMPSILFLAVLVYASQHLTLSYQHTFFRFQLCVYFLDLSTKQPIPWRQSLSHS